MEVTPGEIFPPDGRIASSNSPTDEYMDRNGDDCETGPEAKAEPNTEFDEMDLKYFRRIIMEVRSMSSNTGTRLSLF